MRLIEQVWFHSSIAKYWLLPLLLPFSAVFWLISTLRRIFYQIGLFEQIQINIPVIVVGNISVGGNGKTPVVLWLIEKCQVLGLKVGVISRGYGGHAEKYPLLLDVNTTTDQAGDEPIMIYQRTGVAVVVGGDRVASAKLLTELACDVIISDDGLQHYRLVRALELVIIDGDRGFGNKLLLPAGPLREGQWRLKTVDHVIVNVGNNNVFNEFAVDEMVKVISMSLKVSHVCHMLTGELLSVADFSKLYPRVNAIAGIGAPERFFSTLSKQKINVVQQQGFADHYAFQRNDLNKFNNKLPLLMTEKDAVKCKAFAQQHWWYMPVEADFKAEQINPLLEQILYLTSSK